MASAVINECVIETNDDFSEQDFDNNFETASEVEANTTRRHSLGLPKLKKSQLLQINI